MTLITPQKNHVPVVSWLIIAVEFLVLGMLYPYSRYAVQWIIDYWNGSEQVIYDGSIKSSLDRKFAKLMVSLLFMLVLGPACLLILLAKHLRRRQVA